MVYFPQFPPSKPCMHFSCLSYVPHAPPISFLLIWSPELYLVRNTENKAPCFVVFFTLLSPRPSQAQISSSSLYSHTPSAYVSPTMCVNKPRTHTQQQAKLQFCISSSLNFWIANCKTKYSAPTDSMRSLSPICSLFLDECNCDFLGFMTQMQKFLHFKIIYYKFLSHIHIYAIRQATKSANSVSANLYKSNRSVSGFGGLEVACWPLVPNFAGSNPAKAVGFFRAQKSSAHLPSEGK